MSPTHPIRRFQGLVLDCAPGQAAGLADFYARLLGWERAEDPEAGWAMVAAPGGWSLDFQEVEGYAPPAWPGGPGQPGQMEHMDFRVDDLQRAVDWALSCGARLADTQYYRACRTLLDPAGHPFCLDASP